MSSVTLLILDGWGISTQNKGNAIVAANPKNYNYLLSKFPSSVLDASGLSVGLPPGLMGNSEVGHLNIGAGRVVIQKLTQISQTIIDGSFFANPVLLSACKKVKNSGGTLHIFGLLSDGCVHSSLDHLDAILTLTTKENLEKVVVHPILDGRDTPPKSALRFVNKLEKNLTAQGRKIGVVCGRYYAMDRDNRWERIEKYWRALILGEGFEAQSANEAVEMAYQRGETDEFVLPTIVNHLPIKDGDAVICFNFRPDRVRQISRALTTTNFDGFARPVVPSIYYVCLTQYDAELALPVAFSPEELPSQDLYMTLPQLLSCQHIKQLHMAETEKYAHVTYFLNGGQETANVDEERVLVPSLKVATYDQAPAMQTPKICELACQAIYSGQYPFIVINFANPDMVGHTGCMAAAVEAVKSVDDAFGKLLEATQATKGTLIITADHGNVEQMIDLETGQPHTAHTTNPVPFIVADFSGSINGSFQITNGALEDIAPTIVEIMKLNKPIQMTGTSLLKHR